MPEPAGGVTDKPERPVRALEMPVALRDMRADSFPPPLLAGPERTDLRPLSLPKLPLAPPDRTDRKLEGRFDLDLRPNDGIHELLLLPRDLLFFAFFFFFLRSASRMQHNRKHSNRINKINTTAVIMPIMVPNE